MIDGGALAPLSFCLFYVKGMVTMLSKIQDTILGIGAGLGVGIAASHEDKPSFQMNSNRLIAEFLKQDRVIAVAVDNVPYIFIHGIRKGFHVMGHDMSISETEAYLASQYKFAPGKGVLISCFNYYHPTLTVGDTVFETPEWAMTKGMLIIRDFYTIGNRGYVNRVYNNRLIEKCTRAMAILAHPLQYIF